MIYQCLIAAVHQLPWMQGSYQWDQHSSLTNLTDSSASSAETVRIVCDDTTVFVLLVYWTWRKTIRKNIQVEKWDDTVLAIRAPMDTLGCKCGQLPGIHALSDCDPVSYPYGKVKKSALKVLMNNDVWSRKSPSICACSNRKARRLGLIRQSTQSLSNWCSQTASLYLLNSVLVRLGATLEEIPEQYCRNEMACT